MERRNNSQCGLKLFVTLLFAYLSIVASDPVRKTMQDAIVSCPTVKFLHNSSYITSCKDVLYPLKPITLKDTDDDNNLALCMTVGDIANKICMYNTRVIPGSNNKFRLPENSEQFDKDIKKLEPGKSELRNFIISLCRNMPPTFEKSRSLNLPTESEFDFYVKYVNGTLLTPDSCPLTCKETQKSVNRFCMIYLWASELFAKMEPLKEEIAHEIVTAKEQDIAEKGIPKESVKSVFPPKKVVEIGGSNSQPKSERKGEHLGNQDIQVKNPSTNPGTKKVVEPKKETTEHNDKEFDEPTHGKAVKPPVKALDETSNIEVEKPEAKGFDETLNGKADNNKEEEFKVNKAMKMNQEDANTESKGVENQKKIAHNLPVGNNEETSIVGPKTGENNIESSNNIQEEGNPDDFISGEEAPIKKESDNDIEEANERENIDTEIKDPINNQDDGAFMQGNSGDSNMMPQGERKFFQHPLIAKEEDESHFFTYFSLISFICVILYIGFHNKQKILAMLLEGKRTRRGRGSRRRPSTASYRKLDSNLEEAVTSQCSSNVTHVIY